MSTKVSFNGFGVFNLTKHMIIISIFLKTTRIGYIKDMADRKQKGSKIRSSHLVADIKMMKASNDICLL